MESKVARTCFSWVPISSHRKHSVRERLTLRRGHWSIDTPQVATCCVNICSNTCDWLAWPFETMTGTHMRSFQVPFISSSSSIEFSHHHRSTLAKIPNLTFSRCHYGKHYEWYDGNNNNGNGWYQRHQRRQGRRRRRRRRPCPLRPPPR